MAIYGNNTGEKREMKKNWYPESAYKSRTTLTFNFDEEAVKAAGLTTDELLEDMRDYAKKCEITEVEYGVFEKIGIDAMAMLIGYAVRKDDVDPKFINYLTSWIADVDGSIEDCKAEILEIRERENSKRK